MAEKTEKILDIKVNYEKAIKAIANYRTKIDELKEAEKSYKEQLKKKEIGQEEYNRLMAKSKLEVQEYNEKIRVVSRQIRNQRKEQEALEGSAEKLRLELSRLISVYDEMSEAERNTAKGEALKDKINDVTDALKEIEEETQRYQRNVGNYEESIKSALGLNNSFADSILRIQKRGKGNILTGFNKEIKVFSKTLSGLLKNPVFIALAGIVGVGVAFKWFYDYNKGLVEATRLTRQFTGLAGDELKMYRNEVQVIADTYKKDFTEVLRGANSVSKQFGISQQEALELIKDGFIAGADASGEFMDILREYPAYFKEAGISAEEFVAITTNASQQGIFSDKGIDAIKEANIRLREMTTATASALEGIGISAEKVQEDLQSGAKSTWDVMREVADRMAELPESSAQVGAAIADVFGEAGEDAGLAYLKTLGNIETDMDRLKEKTGSLGEAQEELLQAQLNFQNALSGLADMTGGTFEQMKADAKSFLYNGLASIINGIKDVIDWFKSLYDESMVVRGALQAISIPFQINFQTISMLLKKLVEELKLAGRIIKAVFTLDWEEAEQGISAFMKNIKDGTVTMVTEVNEIFRNAYDKVVRPERNTAKENNTQSSTNVSTSTPTVKTNKSIKEMQDVVKAKQKELTEVRKAEDELLKLVKDGREKQTQEISLQYDRQIEDLRIRLKTETDLTVNARKAINQQIASLEEQKKAELQKLSDEQLRLEIQQRQKVIATLLESVKEGSEQEFQLKLQSLIEQRNAELAEAELSREMRMAIEAKYDKQINDLYDQRDKELAEKQAESLRLRMENELMEMQQNGASELEMLQEQANQKLELLNSIYQQEGESEEAFLNRKLQANQEYTDAKKALADKEVEIEQTKVNALATLYGQISKILELAGENNRDALVLAKTLAIAEVAINQGVSIANAVRSAAQGSKTVWDLVANIAAAVTTVVTTIASATKSIKSAKFASGGLVTGPGTGTSDSIPAQLSNGESVMTAKATSMFSPILSYFNQAGGGVPINVSQTGNEALGEEMLARAFSKALVKMPSPVVSVEEINRVSKRVKALENLGNL